MIGSKRGLIGRPPCAAAAEHVLDVEQVRHERMQVALDAQQPALEQRENVVEARRRHALPEGLPGLARRAQRKAVVRRDERPGRDRHDATSRRCARDSPCRRFPSGTWCSESARAAPDWRRSSPARGFVRSWFSFQHAHGGAPWSVAIIRASGCPDQGGATSASPAHRRRRALSLGQDDQRIDFGLRDRGTIVRTASCDSATRACASASRSPGGRAAITGERLQRRRPRRSWPAPRRDRPARGAGCGRGGFRRGCRRPPASPSVRRRDRRDSRSAPRRGPRPSAAPARGRPWWPAGSCRSPRAAPRRRATFSTTPPTSDLCAICADSDLDRDRIGKGQRRRARDIGVERDRPAHAARRAGRAAHRPRVRRAVVRLRRFRQRGRLE